MNETSAVRGYKLFTSYIKDKDARCELVYFQLKRWGTHENMHYLHVHMFPERRMKTCNVCMFICFFLKRHESNKCFHVDMFPTAT